MPPNVFGERARAYLSPACLRIDNSVRLSSSLPLWKGIVTLPSLVGCTYCLCEPFCSLNTQPSARIIFSISRGFNGIAVNSLQVWYTILYVLCQYVIKIFCPITVVSRRHPYPIAHSQTARKFRSLNRPAHAAGHPAQGTPTRHFLRNKAHSDGFTTHIKAKIPRYTPLFWRYIAGFFLELVTGVEPATH